VWRVPYTRNANVPESRFRIAVAAAAAAAAAAG